MSSPASIELLLQSVNHTLAVLRSYLGTRVQQKIIIKGLQGKMYPQFVTKKSKAITTIQHANVSLIKLYISLQIHTILNLTKLFMNSNTK